MQGFAEKVFHLHLRYYGDNDEVYFRDYLNEHAEIAKLYEEMKLNLWKQYEHDRDGYTEAKREFVKKIYRNCETTKKQLNRKKLAQIIPSQNISIKILLLPFDKLF